MTVSALLGAIAIVLFGSCVLVRVMSSIPSSVSQDLVSELGRCQQDPGGAGAGIDAATNSCSSPQMQESPDAGVPRSRTDDDHRVIRRNLPTP